MPIFDLNENNIKDAEAFVEKAKNNPNVDTNRLNTLQSEIAEYYGSKQDSQKDLSGKNTTVFEGPLPAKYEPESTDNVTKYVGRQYQFYEPSLDSVKEAVQNPDVMKSLGYDVAMTPEQAAQLNEGSPEYKAYADNQWRNMLSKAQQEGHNAYRYSKMNWSDDFADKARSGMNSLLMSIGSGIDDAVTGGIGKQVLLDDEGRKQIENIENTSVATPELPLVGSVPLAYAAGGVLGFLGGGVAKSALKGAQKVFGTELAKSAGKTVSKEGAKRLGRAAGVGAVTVTAEETAKDVVDAAGDAIRADTGEQAKEIIKNDFNEIIENTAGRLIAGAAFGAGGQVVSDAASKGAAYVADTLGKPLQQFKEAGGEIVPSLFNPFKQTPEMLSARAQSKIPGQLADEVGVAVERVAPKITQSIQNQEKAAYQRAEANLEGYFGSDEGKVLHSTQPILNSVIEAADSILQKGEDIVAGKINTQPEIIRTLQQELPTFVQRVDMSLKDAQAYAAKNPNVRIMNTADADVLIKAGKRAGRQFRTSNSNSVAVLMPRKVNARQLIKAEQRINKNLGYAKEEGGKDLEGLKIVEKGFKELRDKYKGNRFTTEDVVSSDTVDALGKTSFPKQLTAYLDDGTQVTGLSALQNHHHKLLKSVEDAAKGVGASSEKGVASRVARFGQPKPYYGDDKQLLAEARKVSDSALSAGRTSNPSPVENPKRVIELREKSREAAKTLTEEELDAIHSYTSRGGDKVGTPVWESAIEKLSVENPTNAGPLYRGTRVNDKQLKKMLNKGVVSFDTPTSTSYNQQLASAFSAGRVERGNIEVIFKITDLKRGHSLMAPEVGIGRSGMEREIMIHNKNLKIKNTSTNEDGQVVIELTDLSIPKTLEHDLRTVSGLNAMNQLKDRANVEQLAKPISKFEAIIKGSKLRADPILNMLAGQPTNPYVNELTPAGRILKALNEQAMLGEGVTPTQSQIRAAKLREIIPTGKEVAADVLNMSGGRASRFHTETEE